MKMVGGVTVVLATIGSTLVYPAQAAADEWIADYVDDFDASTLDEGWTLRDGYALAFPEDTANHASFSLAEEHLAISIPAGTEHNMWDLKHAEALRSYEGSGVYQIKVDSDFAESQQFGLIFESSPGTFLLFMLYAHNEIHAYVERFVQLADGTIHKRTTHGMDTGLFAPHPGPYFIRVSVNDTPVHTERTWTFEWSLDGATWQTATSGVFEGPSAFEDVGAIQTVSVFAGNQPEHFSAFEARFDYFYATSAYVPAPLAPPAVVARSTSERVDLSWNELSTADDYVVLRSNAPDGPFTPLALVPEPSYSDSDVVNGTAYYYQVIAKRDGHVSGPSAVAVGTPHLTGLEAIPSDGRVLALLASELQPQLSDGSPVTEWVSAGLSPFTASSSGQRVPTFVASGIGGVPSVRFDGVDDFLSLGAGFENFTAGLSMYVVARPSALQPSFKMVALGNGAGQQNIGLGRAGSGAGLQYWTTRDNGAYGWFDTEAGLATGDPAVYSVVQAGGAENTLVPASATRNGITIGSGDVYVPPVTNRSVNYIGKSYWSEGWFQGDIAEILIYNRQLSPAEQATVTNYLTTKYSITPSAPAVPAGLAVEGGDASVAVAWNAVEGATGYRVYRAGDAAGPYAVVADVATTDTVDQDVTNGEQYYYIVSAYGAGGESSTSSPVSVVPTGPPALPPDIPVTGLVLSLDASNLALADGESVTAWLDASGTANATGSGSALPTFVASGIGGVPSVRFDGVDDFLSLGAGFENFTAGLSMYVVARPSALQPSFKMVALGNGAGQQNIGLGRAGSGAGLQYWTTRDNGAYGWFDTEAGLATGDPAVYSVVQAGGAENTLVPASATRNGITIGSGDVYVPPVTNRSVNYIGKSYWSEGWFQGDIAEILIYNRQLSPAEQATVTNYLTTKYSM